ncbi:MAG: FG-GAP repeat protein [Candidatus Pacebacteria bacterium]|nr:FG-GAP repeat protein [Candidatus Paceibacterota bacterium]
MTVFFVSIFCGNIALADTWTKAYGSNSTDDIFSIELTSNGYILNGYTTAGAFGDFKGISVKLDNNGNKEWVKTFGKESASANIMDILKSIDTFSDGEVTSDGGYIIAGDSTSYSATNDSESLIIKFDSEGNEEWAKTYINGYNKNSAMSIKEVSDGYIITGLTNNFGTSSNKIFVLKIDNDGDVIWARVFGVVNFIDRQTDSGGVIEVSTGYIISGRTHDGTSFIPVFLKLDKNGNKLWAKTITLSSGYDVISGIIETSDGKYIGTGFMLSGGNMELVVFKMDGNGNKIWAKNYGGTETDAGLSIVENFSGEFVVVGYTRSFGAVLNDGFIMKIDSSGNKLLARTFGGDGNDLLSEVHKTSDGYVAVGTAASFSGGNNDVMVLKFDENLDIQGCDANFNVINIASINSSVVLTNTVNVLISSFHNIDGDMIISDIDSERTDSDLDSSFTCGVDTTPPILVTEAWIPDDTTGTEIIDGGVVNLEDIDEVGEFVTIYSNASDASGIQDHEITYQKNGNPQFTGFWFTGGTHSITVPGPLADGDVIEYQAQATDNAVSPNTGYDPTDEAMRYSFTVREACVIDSTPDLIMTGGSDSYKFGASVSLDGDVNGDGYDDIIVAHGYDDITAASGDVEKAYIYFGGPLSDNVADIVLDNNNASDNDTVSFGNINGDAFDDVVVGNPDKNTAYIYFGGSPMDNIVDVTLITVNNNGESVDATGDVNNDGFNDVIIADNFDKSYLFYGGVAMDGIADLTFSGSGGFDVPRVSFAGDINGDGYDDLLIGNDNLDRAYLYYGGSPMNNAVDIIFTDANSVDQERVSSAGDVNNDGFDDILLASPWEGIGVPNWVYLYYGSATMNSSYTNLEADLSFTNPNWVFFLDISYGNLNGDSFSDIIISDIEEKKAYIYYGGSAMDNVADVIINGPDDTYWGWSTSLGNFDESGFDEIVIGAQFANAGGVNRGQAFVYKCLPPNIPPTASELNVIPDYCAKDLDDIRFSWNFSDPDEHDQNLVTGLSIQTAFEITIDYGTGPCSTGIIEDTRTSVPVSLINSSGTCLNVIQYGRSNYDWTVTVYDSFHASDSDTLNNSLNNMPDHKKPIADFSHLPPTPVLSQDIVFDPLIAPDNSICYDDSNSPVDCLTFEWDFDNDGTFEGNSDSSDPTEIYSYSDTGIYVVDMKVMDSDNNFCFASDRGKQKTINIGYGNPKWDEIAPSN